MKWQKVLLEVDRYSGKRIYAVRLVSEHENSWRIWYSGALFTTVIPKDPEYKYKIIPR